MFNILHIDNSSFFRKMVQDSFKESGYNCFSADTVDNALKMLDDKHIDLIITGIEIKGGGGQLFLKKLNTSPYNTIPVIVVASTDSMEIRQEMFSLGVIDYIEKSKTFSKKLMTLVNNFTEENKAIESLKKMKIAVLDDSKMELNIIKNILSINKITNLTYFTNPVKLLNSETKFDIYFIDLVLPHISGEHVILKLRETMNGSIIIAISSIDNYKVVSNVLLSGADDYILKPFNASIFLARLISNVRHYMTMTDLRTKNKTLEQISQNDSLINVYNHRYIYKILEQKIAKIKKLKIPLSIIIFGIDNFAEINKQFGHNIGDKILKMTGETIKNTISKRDFVGRYGGVEFLVVLPNTTKKNAVSVAKRIQAKVNNIKVKTLGLTISAAVTEYHNKRTLSLVNYAEEILLEAKSKGKNIILEKLN